MENKTLTLVADYPFYSEYHTEDAIEYHAFEDSVGTDDALYIIEVI